MESKRFNSKFKEEMEEELKFLKEGTETEKLLAIARIENRCYSHGIPEDVTSSLVELSCNDNSEVVRAWAMRALFHQPSECWPSSPEDRSRLMEAIEVNDDRIFGSNKFASFIAQELKDIYHNRFKFGKG